MIENGIPEKIREVLKEYDIQVLNIRTESYKVKKGVWWIGTPNGWKILKQQAYSAKTIEFILAAVEYLTGNGIKIPGIIKSKNGNRYVLFDKTCYVLSDAIEGENLNYNSNENIEMIVKELARFHRASHGFKPPDNCKVRTHLGGWIKKYREQMQKVRNYYELERSESNHTKFGEIILQEFPYFYERMEQAIAESDQPPYYQWVEEVNQKGGLCHQDFTAGNLILDKAKNIYVLDTDSITIDIPLRDIRKLLNKIVKRKGQWDLMPVKDILMWYQRENPLKSDHWQVLKPTLFYPHLFVGIMSKYYEKREQSWSEGKYLQRLNEMIKLEKSIEPVIKNAETILPCQS